MLARFFFIQDPDGYKIEVLQRGGHYVGVGDKLTQLLTCH